MKQWHLITAVAFGMAFMTACSSDEPTNDTTLKEIGLSPAEIVVGEDMGEFNTELFKAFAEIEDKDDNLIVSPFSISAYLSMQANYCSETTRQQIFNALGTSELDALNSFNDKMISNLDKLDRTTTFNLANSVWYDRKYSLKPTAKENLTDYYAAEIFPCDPENPDIKDKVNDWIKDKTNNKITDFYKGGYFISMVINALYFNGSWKDKFNSTEKAEFYVGDKIYMVDMMKRIQVSEKLAKSTNFTACRRDFGNGAYACTFILPDESCDINEFIAGLSYDDIAALNFSSKYCSISVPRFELRGKYDTLTEVFGTLGIYNLDTPVEIGTMKEKPGILVQHETYLNLHEEGAEAAAVTGDIVYSSSGTAIPFTLNRPFIFMINETSTNACILAGRISKFK